MATIITMHPTWSSVAHAEIEFYEITEGGPGESNLDSDPEGSGSAEAGVLGATGGCGTLMYSGDESDYVSVGSDGTISVTDADGLNAYFDSNEMYSLCVHVTDGIDTVNSSIILRRAGILPSTDYMSIETGAGSYNPTSAAELIEALNEIAMNNDTISLMVIKGHGSFDGVEVENDVFLTTTSNPNGIFIGNTDVTNVFNQVTDANTKIYLRACLTDKFAQSLSARLDGARVWGAIRFVISVPGTPYGIYCWRSYSQGAP
jgi:hypothetical protein